MNKTWGDNGSNPAHCGGTRECQLPDYQTQPGMNVAGINSWDMQSQRNTNPIVSAGSERISSEFLPGYSKQLDRRYRTANKYGAQKNMLPQSLVRGAQLPVQDQPTLETTAWSSLGHFVIPHVPPVAPLSLPGGISPPRRRMSGRASIARPPLSNIFSQEASSSAFVPTFPQAIPYYYVDIKASRGHTIPSNSCLPTNSRSPIFSHDPRKHFHHEDSQVHNLCSITNPDTVPSKMSNLGSASAPTDHNYSYLKYEWQGLDEYPWLPGEYQPNNEPGLIQQGFPLSLDTQWPMNMDLFATECTFPNDSHGAADKNIPQLSANAPTLSVSQTCVDKDQTHSRSIPNLPLYACAQYFHQSQAAGTNLEQLKKRNSTFIATRTHQGVIQPPSRLKLKNKGWKPSTQGHPQDVTGHIDEVDTKMQNASHSVEEDKERADHQDFDERLRQALLEHLHSDRIRESVNYPANDLNMGNSIEPSTEPSLGSYMADYQNNNMSQLYQPNYEGNSAFDQVIIEAQPTEMSPMLEQANGSTNYTLLSGSLNRLGNIDRPKEIGRKESSKEVSANHKSLQSNLELTDGTTLASYNGLCSAQERSDPLSQFDPRSDTGPSQRVVTTPPVSSLGVVSSKNVYDLGIQTPNFSGPHFTIKISKIMKVDAVWYFQLCYAKEGDSTARDVEISRNRQYKTYRRIGAAIIHRQSSKGVLYWRSDRAEVLHYNAA